MAENSRIRKLYQLANIICVTEHNAMMRN